MQILEGEPLANAGLALLPLIALQELQVTPNTLALHIGSVLAFKDAWKTVETSVLESTL